MWVCKWLMLISGLLVIIVSVLVEVSFIKSELVRFGVMVIVIVLSWLSLILVCCNVWLIMGRIFFRWVLVVIFGMILWNCLCKFFWDVIMEFFIVKLLVIIVVVVLLYVDLIVKMYCGFKRLIFFFKFVI